MIFKKTHTPGSDLEVPGCQTKPRKKKRFRPDTKSMKYWLFNDGILISWFIKESLPFNQSDRCAVLLCYSLDRAVKSLFSESLGHSLLSTSCTPHIVPQRDCGDRDGRCFRLSTTQRPLTQFDHPFQTGLACGIPLG